MARKPKTFLLSVGTEYVAVAATSKRAAVEALNNCTPPHNWSLYAFSQYASDLEDSHTIAAMCLAQIGQVFVRPMYNRDAPWRAEKMKP